MPYLGDECTAFSDKPKITKTSKTAWWFGT